MTRARASTTLAVASCALLSILGCQADATVPVAEGVTAKPTAPPGDTRPAGDAPPTSSAATETPADTAANGAPAGKGGLPPKTVIGGSNVDPQMGLFALDAKGAAEVDARMGKPEEAYRHAQRVATKAWAGKRTFCEDAVRQIIGFYGVDGMMDDAALRAWKTADPARIKAKHMKAIVERHKMMFEEHEPKVCEATLETYVEALRFAASEGLKLRNFGY